MTVDHITALAERAARAAGARAAMFVAGGEHSSGRNSTPRHTFRR